MKKLNEFIVEKFKINSNTVKSDDQWVLINAPAWSNNDSSTNNKFRNIFDDRIFYIDSYDGIASIKMQVVMVKVSELETVKEIYNYRSLPKAYELPIKANQNQIKKFIKDHKDNWNYRKLKRYE